MNFNTLTSKNNYKKINTLFKKKTTSSLILSINKKWYIINNKNRKRKIAIHNKKYMSKRMYMRSKDMKETHINKIS